MARMFKDIDWWPGRMLSIVVFVAPALYIDRTGELSLFWGFILLGLGACLGGKLGGVIDNRLRPRSPQQGPGGWIGVLAGVGIAVYIVRSEFLPAAAVALAIPLSIYCGSILGSIVDNHLKNGFQRPD